MEVVNVRLFDRFSLLHFATGMVAGQYLDDLEAFTTAVAFETVEDRLKRRAPQLFPHPSPDSKINALGDLLSFGAGYVLSSRLF